MITNTINPISEPEEELQDHSEPTKVNGFREGLRVKSLLTIWAQSPHVEFTAVKPHHETPNLSSRGFYFLFSSPPIFCSLVTFRLL